jgi:hypothetical protein
MTTAKDQPRVRDWLEAGLTKRLFISLCAIGAIWIVLIWSLG